MAQEPGSIERSACFLALILSAGAAAGAEPARAGIYTCIDATGKRLTSDRTIPECTAREQRVLNSDGSVRKVVPPTLTAEEFAEAELRERAASAERAARQDAIRRDRNLLARFPNEAAHRKAREAALDDVRKSVNVSRARVKLLEAERQPLVNETEFYVGKPLPSKLKAQLDANDASLAAQQTLIQNQESEVVRINNLYDSELARLKKLWAGAAAGSLSASSAAQIAPVATAPALR